MPAKRIIILDDNNQRYNYVMWFDVPAGNQQAYINSTATSAYLNATDAELQALRNGTVIEKQASYKNTTGTPVTIIQTDLQAQWTIEQARITAEAKWANSGRFWNGTIWTASVGVPNLQHSTISGPATFFALTPVSVFAANKLHFVLFNGLATGIGQAFVAKIQGVFFLPGIVAVTGAAGSIWTLRRREAPTTNPAGGTFAAIEASSARPLLTGITLHNAPVPAPAGGTIKTFNEFLPQADEVKLSTLDASTATAVLSPFGGQRIYEVLPGTNPIEIRAGQTLEVEQGATAGVGNGRILCIFTVG